jgi:hypothetical protein
LRPCLWQILPFAKYQLKTTEPLPHGRIETKHILRSLMRLNAPPGGVPVTAHPRPSPKLRRPSVCTLLPPCQRPQGASRQSVPGRRTSRQRVGATRRAQAT